MSGWNAVDIQKQVDYWTAGSREDLEVAEMLCEKGRFRHGLFFAHLAIEKMLKAHVTLKTQQVPPKIHNLLRLAETAGIELLPEQELWLSRFNMFQLEGRYPDMAQVTVDRPAAEQRLATAQEFLRWLTAQL